MPNPSPATDRRPGLDVAQVSRILGHASSAITLDVYTHLFDDVRHAREIRERMAASQFADLLDLKLDKSAAVIPLKARTTLRRI